MKRHVFPYIFLEEKMREVRRAAATRVLFEMKSNPTSPWATGGLKLPIFQLSLSSPISSILYPQGEGFTPPPSPALEIPPPTRRRSRWLLCVLYCWYVEPTVRCLSIRKAV